jgi:hypothetical protein
MDHDTNDVTTTHAGYGEGHPVLLLAMGEHGWSGEPQPVFPLDRERTTIGSAPDADVRLDGLEPVHAQVLHDADDDYVLVLLAPGQAPVATDDDPAGRPGPQALHTGSTFRIGPWALTFQRAESADHGRPFGGREGGEGERQPFQPPRPDYRCRRGEAGER